VGVTLEETTLLGFVGSAERRLEVRRQPDGKVMLVVRQRQGTARELTIVPMSLVSICGADVKALIDLLDDGLRAMPRAG
jgi:hypothetical protein